MLSCLWVEPAEVEQHGRGRMAGRLLQGADAEKLKRKGQNGWPRLKCRRERLKPECRRWRLGRAWKPEHSWRSSRWRCPCTSTFTLLFDWHIRGEVAELQVTERADTGETLKLVSFAREWEAEGERRGRDEWSTPRPRKCRLGCKRGPEQRLVHGKFGAGTGAGPRLNRRRGGWKGLGGSREKTGNRGRGGARIRVEADGALPHAPSCRGFQEK